MLKRQMYIYDSGKNLHELQNQHLAEGVRKKFQEKYGGVQKKDGLGWKLGGYALGLGGEIEGVAGLV